MGVEVWGSGSRAVKTRIGFFHGVPLRFFRGSFKRCEGSFKAFPGSFWGSCFCEGRGVLLGFTRVVGVYNIEEIAVGWCNRTTNPDPKHYTHPDRDLNNGALQATVPC